MTNRVKLYSYARFSSDKQKEGDSIHRQLTLAEEYVTTHPQFNFELINKYQDDGRSAHHGKHLTVGRLGEFLRDVKTGRVDKSSWIGFEDFDRLNRQNYWDAKAVFEEIINSGITVVTFRDGRVFDLQSLRKNSFEFFTALMSMVGANEYTERMSTRAKDAWKSKREAAVTTGKIMSANVPVWINTIVDEVSPSGKVIRQHFELNEEKSAIVRQIIDLFLKGSGCQTIARKLNLENVPMLRKGKYWMPGSIRAILHNEALCGRHVHRVKRNGKAELTIEDYYLPIVTKSTYSEITLLLNSNHNSKTRAINSLANPLQGLCFCTCGSLMTRVSQRAYRGRKPYQKLVCIGAKTGKHKYESIEVDSVLGHLNMLFEFPQSFNPNDHDAMTPLQAKLSEIDRRIERVTDAIATVGLSDALQRTLRGLEDERATVKAQINEEAARSVYGNMQRMAELTVEAKRAMTSRSTDATVLNGLLRRLFSSIKVDIENGEVFATWQSGKVSVLTV